MSELADVVGQRERWHRLASASWVHRVRDRALAIPPRWRVGLLLLFWHAVWQWHGVIDPQFQNQDVAGIVYNARLLLDGGVPYIDTVEVKTPGAFLLLAPMVALGGLRAVWIISVFWGTAMSVCTGLISQSVWGKRYFFPAAILHAGGAGLAGFGGINYSFWMTLPFLAAVLCALRGLLEDDPRRHRLWWMGAGAAGMVAALIKPQASPLLLVFFAALVYEAARARWARVATLVCAGAASAAVVFGLALLPFALLGEPGAWLAGAQDSGTFGGQYVGQVIHGSGGLDRALYKGFQCVKNHLPYAVAMAGLGLIPLFRFGAPLGRPALPWMAWVFVLASIASVGFTLRFYHHDDLQILPALTLIAVRPGGLLGTFFEWLRNKTWVGALMPLWFGAYNMGLAHDGIRKLQLHLQNTDRAVLEMCNHYMPRLAEDQPVLGWGWHSWSVYEHCGRRAPGAIYKALGTVTTPNTNTCNQGFGRVRLRPGPGADRFAADLMRNPPGLILWSDYYRAMGGDPIAEWPEVSSYLEDNYIAVQQRGMFVVLLQKQYAGETVPILLPWKPQPKKKKR